MQFIFNLVNMFPQGHIIAWKSEVIYVMPVQFPRTKMLQTHCNVMIFDKEEVVPS